MTEPVSLWGDWLTELVAGFEAAAPSATEAEVLRQAFYIQQAHKQRIDAVLAKHKLCRKRGS